MRSKPVAFIATVLVIGAFTARPVVAQYKYTTPDGRTVYTDQPPPPNARVVEKRDYANAGSSVNTTNLPYEVKRAAENFPVTFYTTTNCAPCESARNALRLRGIPFVERTVTTNEDINALKNLGLQNTFPALTVGATKLNDWNEGAWQSALTVAGYPTTSRLPASYSNPTPAPLAANTGDKPVATKPAPERPNTSTTPNTPPTPSTHSDNSGFRF
ncbi:MAG TPA: glutaredoxin domain-containing protein [Burkholderiaceae bacterium]|nr:glutaredoxin domain-containing protein [Burkholderiaceae bacterium]